MINYPVNVNGTLWTFVNNETLELTRRVHKPWPNLTGEKPTALKDHISPLLDTIDPMPAYDPATHFVVSDTPVIDLVNDEYRQTWILQERTPEDLLSDAELAQLKAEIQDFGTGTAAQRMTRVERVVKFGFKRLFGEA